MAKPDQGTPVHRQPSRAALAAQADEPTGAIDSHNPSVVVADAKGTIDMEARNAGDPTTCPFAGSVGSSDAYFSFNRGRSWTQPTYTGWTARNRFGPAACAAGVAPIGILRSRLPRRSGAGRFPRVFTFRVVVPAAQVPTSC